MSRKDANSSSGIESTDSADSQHLFISSNSSGFGWYDDKKSVILGEPVRKRKDVEFVVI